MYQFMNVYFLFTPLDTDSFIFSMTGENCVEKIKTIRRFFDFSSLPKNHPLYNSQNKGALGYFKLEILCEILAAIFVRSKVSKKNPI